MGGAERVSRRTVTAAVQTAVDTANDLVGRYNECVRALHETQERLDSIENERKVAEQETNGRLNGQAAWLDQLEKTKAGADALSTLCTVVERVERRTVAQTADIIQRTPSSNTFFGRLWWLVTGL